MQKRDYYFLLPSRDLNCFIEYFNLLNLNSFFYIKLNIKDRDIYYFYYREVCEHVVHHDELVQLMKRKLGYNFYYFVVTHLNKVDEINVINITNNHMFYY
jgi:hypothetical protein